MGCDLAIRLGSGSQQQAAIRQIVQDISDPIVQIKCKFDTLSNAIAESKLESIDLLKLDAELADWEVVNGLRLEDWGRIRQFAMEVHIWYDVMLISEFLRIRGFRRVTSRKLKMGTSCVWAVK